MKAVRAAFACLGLCLCGSAQGTGQPPADQGQVPAIQEEGDFFIINFSQDPQEAVSLEQFVQICQQATGLNFTYNDQTRDSLKQAFAIMVGPKHIPKAQFYEFFQIQMFINEFVCVTVGPPSISVILIQNVKGASAGTLRQKAIYVPPENLSEYEDQPATLITTVLSLSNTDTKTLSTSLRGLLTDNNTQTLLSAGEHSVVLQGFGSNIAALARLLELVDKESRIQDDNTTTFDVVPLEYAAPEDVADLIEQLLEASRKSSSRRVSPGAEQGTSGALGGGDVEAKILVDRRTNSLLIMALRDEMPRIRDLIARLDIDVPEPERNFHVYSLQNAQATEMAEVLDKFLSDSQRVARNATGGQAQTGTTPTGRAPGGESDEVVVVEDEVSNSLLIAANKTRYEEVLDLIRQLDRRQDQVLIETALIELTDTDFRDLGVEWAFADVTGDGGFGATNFGLSDLTDSDGDGVPDLRVPLLSDGVTAGILSGDDVNLPLLVAAVRKIEGANVLNIPSVLVNNNGVAKVTTKDEQPTTTITATGGVGGQTQENFRQYEEAGITLEISPSISASRYLRMQVYLKVSTFTGTFQSNSSIPPPRITRELKSVVNVPDGDTMVIGGIITDNKQETRTSLPFLGDLPLLGTLFRRDTNSGQRTTLYFFVTPHILRDPDFADLAQISYEKKWAASRVIGVDRMRIVDPAFGDHGDAIDLEETFGVPLYRSPERGEVDGESVGLDPERRRALLEGQVPPTDAPGSDPALPPDPEQE
jgi:general secretion pathway protein D